MAVIGTRRCSSSSRGGRGSLLGLVTMMLATLLVIQINAATEPNEIYYYVTVRDFIAAPCRLSNSPTPSIVADSYCPAGLDSSILSNVISGHVDFERQVAPTPYLARNFEVGRYKGKYSKAGQFFPVTLDSSGTESPTKSRPYVLSDLTYDTTGIPKMQYCSSNNEEGYSCDHNDTRGRSVGDGVSFSTWYQDAAKFNIRVGYKQKLFRISGGKYEFDSSKSSQDPISPNFYNPIGDNGLQGWPLSNKEENEDTANKAKKFWFTTEIHNSFQYRGDEVFYFSGDDDVHVFVNNRLMLNLGGMHSKISKSVTIKNYETELGLEEGKIYQFDLFHAERQIHESNFALQTTLSATCNVITTDFRTSGADVDRPIEWLTTGGSTNNSDWNFISGPGFGYIEPDKKALLMKSGATDVVSYMFHRRQHNVGSGFSLSFKFTMTGKGHGFALLLHNRKQGLKNFNGGTGPNLGVRNTDNSIAIVFDMCTGSGGTDCNSGSRQLRMHTKTTGDKLNDVSLNTRKVHDPNVIQDWADGQEHLVEVFFYSRPDWLEVYVDNSLRLVQRNFSTYEVLGGRNAYVGFSSASSRFGNTMDVRVYDVVMKTVKVIPTLALLGEEPSPNPKTFVANGRDKAVFSIKTRDACLDEVDFGGLENLVHGRLISTSLSDAPPSSGRRLQTNQSEITLLPEIEDMEDGFYEMRYSTDVLGTFTAYMGFGDCAWSDNRHTNESVKFTGYVNSSQCIAFTLTDAAVSIPFSTAAPTQADETQSLDTSALVGIGVASGVIALCGSIMIFVGVRIRNQWRREKHFIEEGRRVVAEKNVAYVGDSELDVLQNKLQATLHALQAERAKKYKEEDKQNIIDELLRQKGELQEMVRRQKIMKAGGDPNAIESQPATIAGRVRKSFAASRASRGQSLFNPSRASRGPSIFNAEAGEASASNPLFARIRQSLSTRPGTSRATVIHENPDV